MSVELTQNTLPPNGGRVAGEWLSRGAVDLSDPTLTLPMCPDTIIVTRVILYLKSDPYKAIVRDGDNHGFGFVGGQIQCGMDAEETVREEACQEAGLSKKQARQLDLRFLALLETDRTVDCLRSEWERAGFSSDPIREFGGEVQIAPGEHQGLECWISRKEWRELGAPQSLKKKARQVKVRLGSLSGNKVWVDRAEFEKQGGCVSGHPTRNSKLEVHNRLALMYAAPVKHGPSKEVIEGHRVKLLNLSLEGALKELRENQRPMAQWWVEKVRLGLLR